MTADRPRVAIVGAGFGGLRVAKALGGKPIDVTLVDQHNYHLFQPLLYQVATAGLEPGEIAYPVRRIVHAYPNVEFRLARVDRLDLTASCLYASGHRIGYDYLVLAAGSDANFFGMEDLAAHSCPLKSLRGAVRLRNHVLSCFERAAAEEDPGERSALLTFVVGGGGPTGVEFAGALSELVAIVLRRDYRTISRHEVRIYIVEAESELLSMVHPHLRRAAMRQLNARGIRVRLSAQVRGYDGRMVVLSNAKQIPAATLVWAAGVRAANVAAAAGVGQSKSGGRILVVPSLQLPEHPQVFAIGDIAYLEDRRGRPLPQLAPVAIQQGELVAENILRLIAGQPPKAFHYVDRGTLATIGRHAAVAEIGPVRLSGPIAWFLWLVVHLVQLIGFRNRVAVLLDWTWSYFRYERAIRLITDE